MLGVPRGRPFLYKAFLSFFFFFLLSKMFWYTLAKCLGGREPRKVLSVCISFTRQSVCFQKKQGPGKGPVRMSA